LTIVPKHFEPRLTLLGYFQSIVRNTVFTLYSTFE